MKIDLRKPNLRDVPVGIIVITSKGFEFELIERTQGKEKWKDLTSGITWYDVEEGKYTHYQAVEKFGENLPTKEESQTAEEHGFREVLPNMGRWFWCSSIYPNYTDYAFVFNGYNGVIFDDDRVNYSGSVRLISRTKE